MATTAAQQHTDDEASEQKNNRQNGARPRLSRQERVDRNLKLLEQFGSQVIAPRSTEAWILIRMVYPLNSAVAKLRSMAGMQRTIDEVITAIQPIHDWLNHVSEWLKQTGGDLILAPQPLMDSAQDRQALARRNNAHVIVPKTEEVRKVFEQIVRIDRILIVLRALDLQDLQNHHRLERAAELVRDFNGVVERICVTARVDYRAPRELTKSAVPAEKMEQVDQSRSKKK